LDPDVYSSVYSLMTFAANPQKVLIGVKGLGLFLTTNGATSWSLTGNGFKADRGRSWAMYPPSGPTTYYLGLAGGGVMKSTTGGVSWIQLDTGLKVEGVENNLTISHLSVSTTNANNLYAAAHGRGLFRWSGTEWARVAETGVPNDAYTFLKPMGLAVDRDDDRYVYYSLFDLNQGVYKRDGGGAWSRILAGPFSGAGASKVLQSIVYPSRIFALMYDELPLVSVNGGASWAAASAAHTGFMRLSYYSMAENPLDSARILASTNKGLFLSANGGYDWAAVAPVSGLPNTILTGMVFSPTVNGRVWAVDLSGGYYCSNDSGSTWVSKTDPLLGSPILDLKMIAGTLYLITDGSGVLRDASPTCP
jgi:photosystem II stability/assembly factor-like uncharacterized protein